MTALMTENQVAEFFQVAPRTVRRWATKGYIPAVSIGGVTRYRSEDVSAAAQSGRAHATPRRGSKSSNA